MPRTSRALAVLISTVMGLGAVVAVAPSAQAAVTPAVQTDSYPLDCPVGLAYDADGRLWATDFFNRTVVRYDSTGNVDRSITMPSEIGNPRDVEIDADGNLWISDDNGTLVKYSPDGELLVRLELGRALYYNQMTTDGDEVLVPTADRTGIEVRDSEGDVLRTLDGVGPYTAIAVAPGGDIFVVTQQGSVRRFDSAGTLETTFDASINSAYGIAVDAKGNVWVGSDGKVVELSADGEELQTVTGMSISLDVEVGPEQTLASSDFLNKDIGIFAIGSRFTGYTAGLSGSGQVGDELSVNEPGEGVAPTPTSVDYAWRVSGSDTVRSDTKTFTPTGADLGKTIKVSVTLKGDGSEDAPADRTYTASTTVLPQQFSDFSPSISGSGVVGDELTVDAGDISPEPTSTTYAWTVEGSDDVRSTTESFTPAAADKGKKVTVTVTATGEDGNPETRSESASIDVKGKAYGDFTPTYTGSPVVGGTVRAEDPESAPEGTTVVSQWQTRGEGEEDWSDVGEDGVFSPQVADLDKSLRLVQTLSSDDHEDKTSQSAITTIGKGTLTAAKPTISGTAKVGETLTASVGELPDGVSVSSWAWGTKGSEGCLVDPDLDGSSQEVLSSWAGEKVCVVATISADGYDDSTSTSDAVGPVAKADISLPFTPTISDTTPKVGQELTASLPLARGANLPDVGFEWGTRGAGDTCTGLVRSDAYTPKVSDLGKDLCVVFTVRNQEGYNDGVSSPAFTSRVREERTAFVSDRTVRKGQKITISATDLVPGKPYVFRVYGKELTGTAPANGRVSRTWTYPKDAKTTTRKIAVIQRAKPKALYYEVITLRYTR